jgi:hypothetical protein
MITGLRVDGGLKGKSFWVDLLLCERMNKIAKRRVLVGGERGCGVNGGIRKE